MSNRFGFATVVAALLVFSIGSALPAYAQAPECADKNAKISKKIAKPMDAAINALKAQNWQEVLTKVTEAEAEPCLLYTSDAADDMQCVDLGGRRIIKKIFFKQKTAY